RRRQQRQLLLLPARPAQFPIRVVDVLSPPRLIEAADLDMRQRIGCQLNFAPRRRDGEMLHAGTKLRIAEGLPLGIDEDVAPAPPPARDHEIVAAHMPQSWHRVDATRPALAPAPARRRRT